MSVQGDSLNQRQRMRENLLVINGRTFIIIKGTSNKEIVLPQ